MPPIVLARPAMKTRFEVILADDLDPEFLRAAGEEALDEVERVEADLSAFRRDSPLFELNAEAAERPVRVDAALFRLLERAGELSGRLDGAFDLTIGALVQYWKGGAAHDLDEARARVGFLRNVSLDADTSTVSFTRAGVRLDAGALGKGYALERAAGLLRDAGVSRALIHGGTSSVVALGAQPGQEAWVVAIQDPRPELGRRLIAKIPLCDRALSVSAVHGRQFEREGRAVGHVIDPRSGQPVTGTLLAAVAGPDPTAAEAISTALLVLGEPGLDLVDREFPGYQVLIALPGEGTDLRLEMLGDDFQPTG